MAYTTLKESWVKTVHIRKNMIILLAENGLNQLMENILKILLLFLENHFVKLLDPMKKTSN